jgi:hypothetical protein
MDIKVGTYGGTLINISHMTPADVSLGDIAWTLSGINRFNGRSDPLYTVAEHCIALSRVVPPQLALAALIHDAAEAYIGDVITPVKLAFPGISKLENGILLAICECFLVDPLLLNDVKWWDWHMCRTEAQQIMGDPDWAKDPSVPYLDWTIVPYENRHAICDAYLDRFSELSKRESVCLK